MDIFVDKSWVKLSRVGADYLAALDSLLDHAFRTCAVENEIACPCRDCANRHYFGRDVVRAHLIMREMDGDYQSCIWNFHGESMAVMSGRENRASKRQMVTVDQLTKLLRSEETNTKRTKGTLTHSLRRSPRTKEASELTSMGIPTSARRSLFSDKSKQPPHTSEANDSMSEREEMAIVRWSMLLTSMVDKRGQGGDVTKIAPATESAHKRGITTSSTALRRSPRHLQRMQQMSNLQSQVQPRVNVSTESQVEIQPNVNSHSQSQIQPQPNENSQPVDLHLHPGNVSGNTSELFNDLRGHDQPIYNPMSRRRLRAGMPQNEKGRGFNKTKIPSQRLFVDVNENGQPIGDSERKMSSLIGCLAREPRRLPLDIWDWRLVEKQKKDALWNEVKTTYYFPEGREPYSWAMEKMGAAWRGYKSDLKVKYFDGKGHDAALVGYPKHIPEEMWLNLVTYWESAKGKEKAEIGIKNRGALKMPHYMGSMSFARVRAKEKEVMGEEPDPLALWLKAHDPKKKGSRLDDASLAAKQKIEEELARFPEGASKEDRANIFNDVIGENKNGYAKTFGTGVKCPRSKKKRCALEEERAKRLKIEEQATSMQQQLNHAFSEIDDLKDLVKRLAEHQGYMLEENNAREEEERSREEGESDDGEAYGDHEVLDDLP